MDITGVHREGRGSQEAGQAGHRLLPPKSRFGGGKFNYVGRMRHIPRKRSAESAEAHGGRLPKIRLCPLGISLPKLHFTPSHSAHRAYSELNTARDCPQRLPRASLQSTTATMGCAAYHFSSIRISDVSTPSFCFALNRMPYHSETPSRCSTCCFGDS